MLCRDSFARSYLVPYIVHQRMPRPQADRDGSRSYVDEGAAVLLCVCLFSVSRSSLVPQCSVPDGVVRRMCAWVHPFFLHCWLINPEVFCLSRLPTLLAVSISPTPPFGRSCCSAATQASAPCIPRNSGNGAVEGAFPGQAVGLSDGVGNLGRSSYTPLICLHGPHVVAVYGGPFKAALSRLVDVLPV